MDQSYRNAQVAGVPGTLLAQVLPLLLAVGKNDGGVGDSLSISLSIPP